MNIITRYKKTALSALMVFGMSMSAAEAAKCSPCQAAAAAREAARISRQDALQAALNAGKSISREMELDESDPADMSVIEACCSYCAENGVSCGGENSARCKACQQGAIKQSIKSALAAATAIAKRMELDTSAQQQDSSRAPREELFDPCDVIAPDDVCGIQQQLETLIGSQAFCCALINEKLDRQEKAAARCCRKIKHELDEIEDLVELQINQSVIASSIVDVQLTNLSLSITDVFVLLQALFDCTCD